MSLKTINHNHIFKKSQLPLITIKEINKYLKKRAQYINIMYEKTMKGELAEYKKSIYYKKQYRVSKINIKFNYMKKL